MAHSPLKVKAKVEAARLFWGSSEAVPSHPGLVLGRVELLELRLAWRGFQVPFGPGWAEKWQENEDLSCIDRRTEGGDWHKNWHNNWHSVSHLKLLLDCFGPSRPGLARDGRRHL